MKSEQSFYVVYDGPALQSSEMDVRQLAPALHSIGELLEESNRVINGNHAKVTVKVKGSFKSGCFGIDFKIIHSFYDSFVHMFTGQGIEAVLNLAELVGLCSGNALGLIALIRWLKNRPIKRVVDIGDGKFRIEVDDEHYEVEKAVLDLFRDYSVRKALDEIISEPLKKEGLTSFGVGEKRGNIITISKAEGAYFSAPSLEDELINEACYETAVRVVSVSFQEENMWRLSEDGSTFYAKIEDREYIDRVQSNEEVFAKDDILIIDLRRRQYITEKGNTKTEYTVEKVKEHRSAGRQIALPFDDG